MKFFTPELYLRFNSPNEKVANRADGEWEAAIRDYRLHLNRLWQLMPDPVERLAGLCLHDAELLSGGQWVEPMIPPSLLPLSVRIDLEFLYVKRGDEIISLIYLLGNPVRRHQPREDWPFSKLRTHWLYDEVDVALNHPDGFLHRVLWSDGVVMEIPFVWVQIHRIPLGEDRRDQASRQTA